MKHIYINTEKGISVNKKLIHKFILELTKDYELGVYNLEYNFVSVSTMIDINKRYLNHNYDTDIITFDYSDEKNILDGEIFISLTEAAANSKKYRVTVDNELLRLLIHGILHMIGYDDATTAKRKVMKKIENKMVIKYKSFSKGLINK